MTSDGGATSPSSDDATADDTTTTTTTTADDDTTTAAADDTTKTATAVSAQPPASRPHISWCDSYSKTQSAIDSLSSILGHVPHSLSSSETPALALLQDSEIAEQLSKLLRQPDSGGGDNNLCRWLYDTFQTSVPDLHLVVLRFLPILAGLYLSRASLHKSLAGFEAVLLALYAHETTSRNGQALTVSIPDLSHSSIYHESKQAAKNGATELNMAVISSSLEPQGRVRSTRRARIVGVALELYYSKISEMPMKSKFDFCEFCRAWAGEFGDDNVANKDVDLPQSDGDQYQDKDQDPQNNNDTNKETEEKEGRIKEKEGTINLPWEILQPILRILGHCLMGPGPGKEELRKAACGACRALYARSLHDLNPRAVLATGSLLKLVKMDQESTDTFDHTEIPQTNVINL